MYCEYLTNREREREETVRKVGRFYKDFKTTSLSTSDGDMQINYLDKKGLSYQGLDDKVISNS